MSFFDRWSGPEKKKGKASDDLKNRIRESLRAAEPLKPRLEQAHRKLQIQVSKMEAFSGRLQQRDKQIFNNVIEAVQSHETNYAKSLSNELSQIRKINKVVKSTMLTTEQVRLRLETVTQLGDVASTLTPTTSVIKDLRSGLSSVIPTADQSLSQISESLGDILNSTYSDSSLQGNGIASLDPIGTDGAEITKIMQEASAVVEVNMEDKLPDLPPSKTGNKGKSQDTGEIFPF
ncbi:MAG TPA: Snf7 family protein [Nitrososphaeraceae archaeon]|nr:Snf7 family protein [Nitrososphaeraceae archaeon]